MLKQIPSDAMVVSEDEGVARFIVSEDLVVTMANGKGISLSIQIGPAEARQFAEIFDLLADDVEKRANHYLDFIACEGNA